MRAKWSRFFFIFILMFVSVVWLGESWAATHKICRIGQNPVATDQRWNPETEFIVELTGPIFVQMLDARGEESDCLLAPPYHVVASKADGKWLRVLECANPLVGPPTYTMPPGAPKLPPPVDKPPATPPADKPPVAPPPAPPITTPHAPAPDVPAADLLIEGFVGPTLWRIPWGDGYENVSVVNGIGVEGGIRFGGLHTMFGGLFAHRRPQSELLVADDCACWEDRASRWPCLTAHFEHRAVNRGWSWGAELGYRLRVTRRLSVGPSLGHTDFGRGFERASLVNTVGLGFNYETMHSGMFSLGVYRVKRPALAETSQTVEVCWPDYGDACKSFAHTWPGQPAENTTAVKAAWGWWF